MVLQTFHPSSVLFTVGGFPIRWYAVLMAAAVAAAWFVARRTTRDRLSTDQLADLGFWVVLFGFIGARLYHVLNEPAYYWAHPLEIAAVWNGGLAIHGAFLGGALAAWVWARRRNVALLWILDRIAPGVALGQAIGRWGNYFNQELFGHPTALPWGIPIDPNQRPPGFERFEYFHPTFLYESLGDLLLFSALWYLGRRWAKRRDGALTLVFLAGTAAVRLATEFLRIDRVPILFGVRLPLLASGAILLSALVLLLTRHARPPANVRP